MDPEQIYPRNRGEFRENELIFLAKALGFRGTTFLVSDVSNFREASPITQENFYQLLDNRTFERSLHKTFNNKEASYNVKVTKTVIRHLQRKALSFSEIRQVGKHLFCLHNFG